MRGRGLVTHEPLARAAPVDGDVGRAVAVVVAGHRNVAGIPELDGELIAHEPLARRRPEDGDIGRAVAVVVAEHRNVAGIAELDGELVAHEPLAALRSEDREVDRSVPVEVARRCADDGRRRVHVGDRNVGHEERVGVPIGQVRGHAGDDDRVVPALARRAVVLSRDGHRPRHVPSAPSPGRGQERQRGRRHGPYARIVAYEIDHDVRRRRLGQHHREGRRPAAAGRHQAGLRRDVDILRVIVHVRELLAGLDVVVVEIGARRDVLDAVGEVPDCPVIVEAGDRNRLWGVPV